MFINAERKEGDPNKNNYNPIRVYWWEPPNRDEKWKNELIKIIGPEEFERCYDLSFKYELPTK